MIKANYRIQVLDGDETVLDTGEFSNMILPEVLNHGDPFSTGYLAIGTGARPPSDTDTDLESPLGQVAALFENASSIVTDGQTRFVRRGAHVELTGYEGTVREVGFRKTVSGDLISRTLVRDGNGLLTSIPVESHQTLKISYFVYFVLPEVLSQGVINTGVGDGVNYEVKPPESITTPAGYFAGRFNYPFVYTRDNELVMTTTSGNVASTSIDTSYDEASRVTTVIANWEATDTNRTVTGMRGNYDPDNLPEVFLESDFTLPADSDLTLRFEFSWGHDQ